MAAPLVDPEAIAAVAAAIARAPLVAFDVEFASADRRTPVVCLLQVGWVDALHGSLDAQIALIDAIAGDPAPVARAIAAHPLAVAHAARQDLELLAARYGAEVQGIRDTQLMAAFAGIGDQVGLAALAAELCGVTLGKEQQWTAWDKRPLTAAQLAYAAADVAHLPTIYTKLAAQLGERAAWARAESEAVLADALAATRVTAETAWQGIGGARGMDGAAHAAVVALAAWRFRAAAELDKPLGQVLHERQLLDLARARPKTADGVRGVKGLGPIAKTRAGDIAAAIAGAAPAAGASGDGKKPWRAASERAQRWSDALVSIAKVVADELHIASRLLAARADAEEFARAWDEGGAARAAELPALQTWRRDAIGEAWAGWLEGRLALSITRDRAALIPVDAAPGI